MRGADQQSWDLPVPVDLFDVLKALVDEQQLRWQLLDSLVLLLLTVFLQGKIPQGNLQYSRADVD